MEVAKRYADYMHGLVQKVVSEIGPRESCGNAEKELGRLLVKEWEPLCDNVSTEPFSCHPKAFLGFLPAYALLYLTAVACYWLFPLLSFLLAGLAFATFVLELMLYREFADRFFPREQGENIVGVIRPRGEVKRRVIVSAHTDSAYEFTLWYFLKNASAPLIVVAVLASLFLCVAAGAKTLAGGDASTFLTAGVIAAALYPIVGLSLFWHTYTPVPGAMDDMAGVAVVTGLARHLRDSRQGDGFFPEATEVVLIGMGAEEAGLRGAKRYVEAHKAELERIPSYGLFVDGVYDEQYLSVVHRELFIGAKHSPQLIELAKQAAAQQGRDIKVVMVPVGATDAAAFTLGGVPSTCILCQDTSRLVPQYHTRLDTAEKVRPESLSVTLQLIIDMLQRIDEPEEPGADSPAAPAVH
jgi:aminopeptidase YwaD